MGTDASEEKGKDFQAIRFREGDRVTIDASGPITVEFDTHKGRKRLKVPKGAKAIVEKRLTEPPKTV